MVYDITLSLRFALYISSLQSLRLKVFQSEFRHRLGEYRSFSSAPEACSRFIHRIGVGFHLGERSHLGQSFL